MAPPRKTIPVSESVTPTQILSTHISKSAKELGKEKLQELIKEETRVVRGIFQCFETPGSTVKITVRKYPGIPHFEKTMTDGESYEVPLYVARHLNGIDASAGAAGDPSTRNINIGTCSYPRHGFTWTPGMANPPASQLGNEGIPVPIVGVVKRVKRFGFQSMEFAGDFS